MSSEQKHSFPGLVSLGRPNTESGGVYKSALIPDFLTGPRYCKGKVRQRSLSQIYTISEPVLSRGGKNDPMGNKYVVIT